VTYEQKYGRPPDGFYQEETPPEDWQFENPLVTVSKDGEVKSRLSQSFARPKAEPPKMRSASDFLYKEVEEVEFTKLDMSKQVKLVAEEYNKGLGPTEVQRKLGIKGVGTYHDRLDKARAMGLVTDDTGNSPDAKARYIPKAIRKEASAAPAKPDTNTTITPDFFKKQAEHRRVKAEGLSQQAERLEQAGMIATELMDLLGESAQDLVNGLYARVN